MCLQTCVCSFAPNIIWMCEMDLWHDSYECVPWHLGVRPKLCLYSLAPNIIWICDMTPLNVWHDSIECVTWLHWMCDMTPWRQSSVWAPRDMCPISRLCSLLKVSQDFNECVTWLNKCVTWLPGMNTRCVPDIRSVHFHVFAVFWMCPVACGCIAVLRPMSSECLTWLLGRAPRCILRARCHVPNFMSLQSCAPRDENVWQVVLLLLVWLIPCDMSYHVTVSFSKYQKIPHDLPPWNSWVLTWCVISFPPIPSSLYPPWTILCYWVCILSVGVCAYCALFCLDIVCCCPS